MSLGTVKESKFENNYNPPTDSKFKSTVSFNTVKSIDLISVLASIKKKIEENGQSKNDIRKLFDKIRREPQLDFDPNKVRVLKTKIDRSYLGLMTK